MGIILLLLLACVPGAEELNPVATIPFQSEYYVAQGMASSCEQNTDCGQENVYVSLYYKNAKQETASIDQNSNKYSRIIEYRISEDTEIRRCFNLRGINAYGHLGGLAYFKGSLYVASDAKIARYKMSQYQESQNFEKYGCIDIEETDYWEVQTGSSVSYAKINGEDRLYVARWCSDEEIDCAEDAPYAYSYALNENGDLVPEEIERYRLPLHVQGIAVEQKKTNGPVTFFLSKSNGSNPSSILTFDADDLYCPTANCDDPSDLAKSEKEVVAGIEDLSWGKDHKLWSVSESYALYFDYPANIRYDQLFFIERENL